MKRILVLNSFLLVLFTACNLKPAPPATLEPEASAWQLLGGIVGMGSQTSLASSYNNRNTVAYVQSNGTVTDIRVKRWDGTTWTNVGNVLSGSSTPNSNASDPSLALDASGNPVVAWSERDGTNRSNIYVQRFAGSGWVNVGTGELSSSSFYAYSPSLALDSAGNPVVAWADEWNIYVKRFDGGSWVNVGSGVLSLRPGTPHFTNPSLALDSSGNPVVAGVGTPLGTAGRGGNIFVQRFNGSSWVTVRSGLSGYFNVNSNPSLALDSSGNPVVAWSDSDGTVQNIYVKRLNKSGWVDVGKGGLSGSSAAGSDAFTPSLALDGTGNPVVAWQEFDGRSNNIYVQQWNGSSWQNVGAIPLDTTLASHAFSPSLSLVNGSLNVAWQEGSGGLSDSLYVKRYWLNFGSALDTVISQDASRPSLKLQTDDAPVVAWQEDVAGNSDVYVKRWTNNAWQAVGGALDITGSNAYSPSLALQTNDVPVVAWSEGDGCFQCLYGIYVKRWTGTSWTQLGGNLSSVSGFEPSLASSGNSLAVAWSEQSTSGTDVYVKQWDGGNWVQVGGALDVTPTYGAVSPSLALKHFDGNPTVAWVEVPSPLAQSPTNLIVKTWNGSSWQQLGGILNVTPGSQVSKPSLVLKSNNFPVVAWSEKVGSGSSIYVKQWDGANWISLGTGLGTLGKNPSLAIHRKAVFLQGQIIYLDQLMLSFTESNFLGLDSVFAYHFAGGSWQWISNVSSNQGLAVSNADNSSIAVRRDNSAVVAFDEWNGAQKDVYVGEY